jgi:hypothetical protein
MATKQTGTPKTKRATERKSSLTKKAVVNAPARSTPATRGSKAIKAVLDSPATRKVVSQVLSAAAGAAAAVIIKEVRGGPGKPGGVVNTLKEVAGSAAAASVDVVADAAKASVAPTVEATKEPRKPPAKKKLALAAGRGRAAKPKK